jgi:ankyrin repeat protein
MRLIATLMLALAANAQAGKFDYTPEQAAAILAEERRLADADTLIHAALMHDGRLVGAVLASGVSPNARGILPQSALQLVVSTQCSDSPKGAEDHLALVDLLIAKGADVRDTSFGDSEIVVWAAQQCPPAVVARLLDAGANIEARTPQGFSPLSMALVVKNYDTAGLLIDRGARLKPETAKKLFSAPGDDARLAALVKRASSR